MELLDGGLEGKKNSAISAGGQESNHKQTSSDINQQVSSIIA
jgi:hypothetical protein